MAILGQGNEGNWNLTIQHNRSESGVEIPATFTYEGISTSFTITNSALTLETGWYTPLGTEIELSAITREYGEVIIGNKKFKVTSDDFTVKAYDEEEHEIRQTITVSPMSTTIDATGNRQLTVILHTFTDGVETSSGNVTTSATYSKSNSAVTVSSSGKIVGNNTSTADTTSVVTVSYPSAGVEPVSVNVTIRGKEVQPDYNITVNPSSLTLDYLANSEGTFVINTSGVSSVKLTSGGTNGDKFSFVPTTGTNGAVITVSTKETNSVSLPSEWPEDYIGTITVSGTNGTAQPVQVSLKQKYEPLLRQFASTNIPATGGSIYATVTSEYDVVFRSVPSWVTITNTNNGRTYTEGQRVQAAEVSSCTISITAESNHGDERTVSSTFNMGHYIGNTLQNRVTYFSFKQEGSSVPSIKVVPTVVDVPSGATSATVNIIAENCVFHHFAVTASGDFSITAISSGSDAIALTFPQNNTPDIRSGYLDFVLYDTSGNNYSASVTVDQAAGGEPRPTGTITIFNSSMYDIYGNITTGDTEGGDGNITIERLAGGSSETYTNTVPFFMHSMQLSLYPAPEYPGNVTITLRNNSRTGTIMANYEPGDNAWLGAGMIEVQEGDILTFDLNV